MTTYPSNIIVLDKEIVNTSMTEKLLTPQTMYSLVISNAAIDTNSQLRLTVDLIRVNNAALTQSEADCNTCPDTTEYPTQDINQEEAITSVESAVEQSAFNYVGEKNGEIEFYFLTGTSSDANLPIEADPNIILWHYLNGKYEKGIKIASIVPNGEILSLGFPVQSHSNVPVYGWDTATALGYDPSPGLYLFFIKEFLQQYCDSAYLDGRADYFSVYNNNIYTSQSNGTGPPVSVAKWTKSTGEIKARFNNISTALPDNGYTHTRAIQATSKYLYALNSDVLIGLDPTALTISKTWNLNTSGTRDFHVIDDTICYFTQRLGNAAIAIKYINLITGKITTIDNLINVETFFDNETIVFPTRYTLYFSKIGSEAYFLQGMDHNSRIRKIGPLGCP